MPANHRFGDLPFDLDASATSGLAVAFSTATGNVCTVTTAGHVTITGAGSCSITARQPGGDDYLAATPVSRTLTVSKATTTTAVTSRPTPRSSASH